MNIVDTRIGDIIVLREYKAVYFSIPKVANSSLKAVIVDLLGNEIEEQYLKREWKPYPFRHHSGVKYLRKKGILINAKKADLLENYWKYCFVRNPWDRLVSCFSEKIRDPSYQDKNYKNGISASLQKFGNTFYSGMKFQNFVEAVCDIPDRDADRHFRSQYLFVTDRNGNKCVNFTGYFERLQEDFSYVAKHCNFPKNIRLPHLLKSKRANYKNYYTRKNIEKVGLRYHQDLITFDYGYESLPEKMY